MSLTVSPRRQQSPTPPPARAQASPLSPASSGWPDPYRVLFPIGLTWALFGAGVWPLHALRLLPYPGVTHRLLMIEGFEQSFVLGFLLTALPGFTKGERCRPAELIAAALSALVFGAAVLAGQVAAAHAVFALSVALLIVAAGRRLRRPGVPPPLELVFVGFGLASGLAGAVIQCGFATGLPLPWPRFGERLISLGMILSLVLGVGGLLVPTFTGMRDPLVIPGVARAHERRSRLVLYLSLVAVFALAFVAELAGSPRLGSLLRAAAASVLGIWVWKLWRLPGRRDVPAFALWGSGWLVMAGLWAAAAVPSFALGALHVVFIGGFALLTLGIGTRVVVAHGRHPIAEERVTLTPPVVAAMLVALLLRLAAEWLPARAALLLGASGGAWMLGWIVWAWRALPRIARVRAAAREQAEPARTTAPRGRGERAGASRGR